MRYPRVRLQRRQTNNWFIVLCLISFFFVFHIQQGALTALKAFNVVPVNTARSGSDPPKMTQSFIHLSSKNVC